MVALEIEDLKEFTSRLFVGEAFDACLLVEARFATFGIFEIDGTVQKDYFNSGEMEEKRIGAYVRWSAVKPFCYFLIKGKRLPVSFKIVFKLSPAAVERFLADRGIPMAPERVEGLYMNIRYEGQKLTCVTGTSLKIFTLDKTLEQQWDAAVKGFLGNSAREAT